MEMLLETGVPSGERCPACDAEVWLVPAARSEAVVTCGCGESLVLA